MVRIVLEWVCSSETLTRIHLTACCLQTVNKFLSFHSYIIPTPTPTTHKQECRMKMNSVCPQFLYENIGIFRLISLCYACGEKRKNSEHPKCGRKFQRMNFRNWNYYLNIKFWKQIQVQAFFRCFRHVQKMYLIPGSTCFVCNGPAVLVVHLQIQNKHLSQLHHPHITGFVWQVPLHCIP